MCLVSMWDEQNIPPNSSYLPVQNKNHPRGLLVCVHIVNSAGRVLIGMIPQHLSVVTAFKLASDRAITAFDTIGAGETICTVVSPSHV